MKCAWVLLAPMVFGLMACNGQDNGALRVSGQIEGIAADVGSRIGGRVQEVLVQEGDRVDAGAVLVRFESDEAESAVAAARAQLASAEAQLAKLEAGAREEELRQAEALAEMAAAQYEMALEGARSEEIAGARARRDAARAQRDDARSEWQRAERLHADAVISAQIHERARHAYEGAEAQLAAAEQQLAALVKGLRDEEIRAARAQAEQAAAARDLLQAGARVEDLAAARAMRDAAAADVRRAEVALREMTVTAPWAGVIESIDIEPGDLAGPGAVARITNPDVLELRVFVSAHTLGVIGLGQGVSLTADAHGERAFEGEIAFIAEEGEFTPRNLQTSEERARQVFAVKIRLSPYDGALRAGMTATAHFPLDADAAIAAR